MIQKMVVCIFLYNCFVKLNESIGFRNTCITLNAGHKVPKNKGHLSRTDFQRIYFIFCHMDYSCIIGAVYQKFEILHRFEKLTTIKIIVFPGNYDKQKQQ